MLEENAIKENVSHRSTTVMDDVVMVDILLATYNGESFLKQQLDSLLNQSYPYIRILIRDDGSSDSTRQIIEHYQQQFPDKIRFINDDLGNIGVTQNFSTLMQQSTADYICFCDQDDIWFEHKIEVSLKAIQQLENGNQQLPCLVYSDMQVINEQNELLYESMWKVHQTHSTYFTFNRLLIYNIPFGCTILFNRALLSMAKPIATNAIFHDHWLALITVVFGRFKAIPQCLMKLRNHANNTSYRIKTSFLQRMQRKIKNAVTKTQHAYWLNLRIAQAKDFKNRFQTKLQANELETLDAFISIESTTGFRKKWVYVKNGFFKPNFWQTLKMILKA